MAGQVAGWVYPAITGTSDLFMNINKNRKARTCQFCEQKNRQLILVEYEHFDLLPSGFVFQGLVLQLP